MILDKFGNKIQPTAVATTKRSGKSNPMAVIEKIAKQFKDTSRKDIQKWRTAIQVAESPEKPRRDLIIDIYDDLMTDSHLSSQMEIRKAATLNTSFQVISKKTGEVNPEKTQLLQKKWFYEFIEHVLDAKFYGFSLIEFLNFDGEKINIGLVPRRNVVPNLKMVVPDWSKADSTIIYDNPKYDAWLIEANNQNLGILNKIVPNLIWKRNIMQSWAEFCERFGIPLITATTLKQDTESLDLIDSMLTQLGEAAHAVFPEGTTLEIKEANRTDAYMVFDKYIERNNEEISKAITGGTMVSDNGSSKSQSEVHERNLEERIAPADRRHITFIINDELIPLLNAHGYNFSEDDFFTFDVSQELTIEKHWEVVKGIMERYEVDQTWLSKTFNVPIIGEREAPTNPLQIAASAAQKKKPEPIMMSFKNIQLPNYPATSCCAKHDLFKVDAAFNDEMEELHSKLFKEVWEGRDTLSQEAGIWILEASRLLSGLREGWGERAVTAAWNEPDHLMLQMMEYNLFEFTSSKTAARLAAMSQLLIDKEKMGIKSFNDFKAAAEKVTNDFNTNWLKTEYNLSVAVGQNSAAWARANSEQDIIPYVQYITAGDSNVRSSHALLDGKIFSLKDKEAMRLWPPNDFGCRCEMIQYPHSVDRSRKTDGKSATKLLGDGWSNSQFGINRGDTNKVFTNKQFYHSIKGMPDKIEEMNYKNTYGLKAYGSIKKGLKSLTLDKSITSDNVKELFRIDGKQGTKSFMGFEDYLKRKIILKEDVFKSHTSDNKHTNNNELRHQLFPHIKSVLSDPNEVWFHEYEKGVFQSRYIKFYNNIAMIVDTKLRSNNLEITTWHQLKVEDKLKRKGLLIKKK